MNNEYIKIHKNSGVANNLNNNFNNNNSKLQIHSLNCLNKLSNHNTKQKFIQTKHCRKSKSLDITNMSGNEFRKPYYLSSKTFNDKKSKKIMQYSP